MTPVVPPDDPIGYCGTRELADQILDGVEDGPALDPLTRALLQYGLRMSVTSLDARAGLVFADEALTLGATPGQLQEVLTLVSALGVHTLMEGSRALVSLLTQRDLAPPPRTAEQTELWKRHIGDQQYWQDFETQVPGFLESLLILSPDAFEAFIAYCAVPATTRHLDRMTKELISLAADATPTHRYLPGFCLHLRAAIGLGAGRSAVLEVLDIADTIPAPTVIPGFQPALVSVDVPSKPPRRA